LRIRLITPYSAAWSTIGPTSTVVPSSWRCMAKPQASLTSSRRCAPSRAIRRCHSLRVASYVSYISHGHYSIIESSRATCRCHSLRVAGYVSYIPHGHYSIIESSRATRRHHSLQDLLLDLPSSQGQYMADGGQGHGQTSPTASGQLPRCAHRAMAESAHNLTSGGTAAYNHPCLGSDARTGQSADRSCEAVPQ
jgi:hypothetical protein